MSLRSTIISIATIAALALPDIASAQMPAAIDMPGATASLQVHAEGAQIYECKTDAAGKLAWAFREPIATLFIDGKTIGRHYAGPSWEDTDGSIIVGKVLANAPGAASGDIPWLKLDVITHRGSGSLADITTIQRINTKGGKLDGGCASAGAFQSVPYAADYVFLKKN